MRPIALVLIAAAMLALPGQAMPAETDPARFSFKDVADGVLRLDSRTGQVSLCSRASAAWTCQALPDDRAAFESEIGRLQDENTALRKDLAARGVPPASGPKAAERQLDLPSDAEVERMMGVVEKMWRRLLEMAERTQRDFEPKGTPRPNKPENRN